MNKVLSVLSLVSSVIGIISTAIALVWFFFGLDNRVKTLENQMQAIYQSASVSSQNTVSKKDGNVVSISKDQTADSKIQNLVDVCATLAIRVANAYEKGSPLSVAQPLKEMMDKLGCNKIQQ
ncbi:hypothetical protein [Pectobacterium aroidearum]|uniref:hypothetical protein n=1 Tax=Pectobacterium aroidearum TaxID=1201031 RepID=UPI002114BB63|nr:hypothetical protein [Pectobacterium aroidearum]UUE36951.1 hypothetical protein L0Y26_03070 [Pectobacterium aroidearum]UUE41329.1 hypothetical protein L0Y25_03070 [Pectobacterium aroidearum]